MVYQIIWNKRADTSFGKILLYLEREWGIAVVKAFVQKVFHLLDLLSSFPEMGVVQDRTKGIRAITIVKQVNLFYRISGDKIILLIFFDNRQKPVKRKHI